MDYTSLSSDKTFISGSTNGTTRCINITILDDGALEGEQNLTVTLTTDDSSISLGTVVTIVTILDDDC